MSVRSTNVYEEQALGVYEPEDPSSGGESEPAFQGDRTEVFRLVAAGCEQWTSAEA